MSHLITRTLLEASLSLTPVQKSAADMRRDAELMYDGAIPYDVLAAIDEQYRIERANRPKITAADVKDAEDRLERMRASGPAFPKEPTLDELNARLVASMNRKPVGCSK